MCLKFNEAKQTRTLEFGVEKDLLMNHAQRMGDLCPKEKKSLIGFKEDVIIGEILGKSCRVCNPLLICWW